MSMNGIDISSHQSGIDLSVVPCDFVIVKATEGTAYVNPNYNAQAASCLNAGKKLGLYHFASGGNAVAEVEFFVDNIQGYIGKAILVLDWEADAINNGVAYAKQFLDRVTEKTGVRPLIYMSNSVVNAYDWSSAAQNYGLWNAGYYAGYVTMGYNPGAPMYGGTGAWGSAVIYQYTSSGRLANWGGNLDLNVFYGNPDIWDRYAGAKKKEKKYIVQVGKFTDIEVAKKLGNRLIGEFKQAGTSIQTTQKIVKVEEYTVQVGKFTDIEAAKKLGDQLIEKGYKNQTSIMTIEE